ncbi:MAG TPA: hypothetical protein VFA04_02775, partial [Bryobacteraceae bacterium]|nr:hypothetical protein [Bryobacteraceae bacterium]
RLRIAVDDVVRFLHGGGVLSKVGFGESILTNRLPPPLNLQLSWGHPPERKVGVMADGGFTTSIPAYSLTDGTYVFGFAPVAPPNKVFAAGTFTIGPLGETAQPAVQHASASLAGHWLGIAGTIADVTINADGTYVSRGAPPATWRQEGNTVIFTGPLAAWNNGRGKLRPDGKVIEFYWTNASGAKQYFVLAKY